MAIKKLIFGSVMDKKVTDKLHTLQASDNNQELSSKTPFVRMWVGMQTYAVESGAEFSSEAKKSNSTFNPKTQFYTKTGPDAYNLYTVTYKTKAVYEINNHNHTIEQSPTEPVSGISNNVFPRLGSSNKFMKPPAGITSVTSNTEGALGALKRTTVQFVVHNFNDYENIISKFILKPGAQIFVDFGWSNASLYDPKEAIESSNIDEFLFDDVDGFVANNKMNMDTIVGIVTKFDAKLKENGGFDCSVELISKNNALLDLTLTDNQSLKAKFMAGINAYIINLAATEMRVGSGRNETSLQFLRQNWNASPANLEESTDYAETWAEAALGGGDKNVDMTSLVLESGVYWQNFSAGKIDAEGELYINWGRFEDDLLNSEIAIGNDAKIALSNGFESEFDSSNSFITLDTNLELRQNIYTTGKAKSKLVFLYPPEWDVTYNTKKGKMPDRPLDYESEPYIKRYPKFYQTPKNQDIYNATDVGITNSGYTIDNAAMHENQTDDIETGEDLSEKKNYTDADRKLNRIPIREIFVKVETIKNAFTGKDSLNDAIKEILQKINEDSYGILDLQLADTNGLNTKLTVVDNNLGKRVDDLIDSESAEDSGIFTFAINNKESIIKSIDLNYTTPKNGLTSMLAIQNYANKPIIVDSNTDVDNAIRHFENVFSDGIGFKYLPTIGDDIAEKMQKRLIDADNSLDESIKNNNPLLNSDEATTNIRLESFGITSTGDEDAYTKIITQTEESGVLPDLKDWSVDSNTSETEFAWWNPLTWWGNTGAPPPAEDPIDEQDIFPDALFANSIEEYFGLQAKTNFLSEVAPTIMPYTLSFSMYGMSGIFPGNFLNVDYLPKKYRDNMFFQVSSVSQNITPSSWTTTIETFPRLKTDLKKGGARDKNLYHIPKIYLSSKWVESNIFIEDLRLGYFIKFTIAPMYTWKGFKIPKDLDTVMEPGASDAYRAHRPVIMFCEATQETQIKLDRSNRTGAGISGASIIVPPWIVYSDDKQAVGGSMGGGGARKHIPMYRGKEIQLDLEPGKKYVVFADGVDVYLILSWERMQEIGHGNLQDFVENHLYIKEKYDEFENKYNAPTVVVNE
jgi:hypothetical protein